MNGWNRLDILFELDDSVYRLFRELNGRLSMNNSNLSSVSSL